MASSKQFVIIGFAVALTLLPAIAMAADYVVGDDKGWTTDFDYQSWAKDKMFNVGDTLVFKYKPPNHNVYKVDGAAFNQCSVPADAEVLTSGTDKVVLKAAGKKWYLCGKPNHCDAGQKLSITVMESATYSAASRGLMFSGYQVFVAVFLILLMIVNVV